MGEPRQGGGIPVKKKVTAERDRQHVRHILSPLLTSSPCFSQTLCFPLSARPFEHSAVYLPKSNSLVSSITI